MEPERGKGLIEQISAEQTLYNLMHHKLQAEMEKQFRELLLFGETTYRKSVDPIDENMNLEPAMDSQENTEDKLQAFEKRLQLEALQFIKDIRENAQTLTEMKDGSIVESVGTYFQYQPDKDNVEDLPGGQRTVTWAWANTGNSMSMARCFKTCSVERWQSILYVLNHITL